MSGNIQGGQKTRQKLIDKLGEAEYSNRMAKMGHKGGIVKTEKGFAKSGLAQEAGRKGGGARRNIFTYYDWDKRRQTKINSILRS